MRCVALGAAASRGFVYLEGRYDDNKKRKKRMVVYEWRFVCLFVSLFHQNYIKAALALYCFFGMFVVVCLVCVCLFSMCLFSMCLFSMC
mgnify:CR=1 FL=1